MKRFLLALLTLFLVTSTYLYFEDTEFWHRYAGMAKSKWLKEPRGIWYDPLVEVKGGQGKPLEISVEQNLIPKKAIDAARSYAHQYNSSSFMVWHDGKLIDKTFFGETNKETLIVSKSMAKPLASITMARAFQQGHFSSLDQSASDFIDEWQGTEKASISIRHILNMSSGLARYYKNTMNPFGDFHRSFLSGKHDQYIIDNLELLEPPGSYYDYSQPTSDLIAVLIERATGQSYEEYVAKEVLQPLNAVGGEIWLNRQGGTAHSGCCILLPADTWMRLGVLLVQNGMWQDQQLIPDWWTTEIRKGSAANPNYGLYFWVGSPHQGRRHFVDPNYLPNPGTLQSEPYAADDLFMFDGNGNQVIYIIPSRDLVIMRTGGWPGKDKDGQDWDNTYLPNTLIRALDAKSGLPSPSFSNAMQKYQPLGLVKGADEITGLVSDVDHTDFSAAINYAKDMDSYALLVWHKDKLLVEKYFIGFDTNLRPETASMHKSVMALTVAAAIEDGFIDDVNSPVGDYIKEWQDQPEGLITVKNLLNMSSGLKPLSMVGGHVSPGALFYSGATNARNTLLNMKLEVEPGSRFSYANTNSQLLAMVLESATGLPYADYLSDRIWKAMGASDAYVWYFELDGFPRTYASLLARPIDWLKVGLLIKNEGSVNGKQVLSAKSIADMTSSSTVNSNYGWQIWLGKEYEPIRYYNDQKTGFSVSAVQPFTTDDMIYFDGFGGQRVYISRKNDLVIVRVGEIKSDWDDTLLPNMVINALHNP